MALRLANVNQSAKVNGALAANNQSVADPDYIETGSGGSLQIVVVGGSVAATVSGPTSTIVTTSPPTTALVHVFQNGSYRYRLETSGGNVGVRG
jgi:hypothetical protein